MKNLIICLVLLLFSSCDKTVEIKPDVIKNKYQLQVDSLIKVGKLKVGDPIPVKLESGVILYERMAVDDITYLIGAGRDSRGNTTSDYTKANSWLITEVYQDPNTSHGYWTIVHNDHLMQIVTPPKSTYVKGSVLPGSVVYDFLKPQRPKNW